MLLSEVVAQLEALAPLELAESWDNVGLLVGDPQASVSRALFAIDLTRAVLREAEQKKCELVVAYHPPIFSGLKRVVAGSTAFDAIARGIALYSPHTALDVAKGGTNDVLGDVVGMGAARSALRPGAPKDVEYKLVTFVPADACERVAQALFEAGAGKIGNYSSCSFRSPGQGTFFGEAGADPKIGEAGRLEAAEELRLETIVRIADVPAVVAALRASHPYEEPAFDLVRLAAPPSKLHAGLGRIGDVEPVPRAALFEKIKKGLGVTELLVAGQTDGIAKRVAVAAGSCGDMFKDAIAGGADVYLTGEMRHHDAIAASAKMTVICALHSNSERAALGVFAKRVKERAPTLEVVASEVDRDPFRVV